MICGSFYILFSAETARRAVQPSFYFCPQCRERADNWSTYRDGLTMNKNLEQLNKEVELLRPSSIGPLERSDIGKHLKYKRGLPGIEMFVSINLTPNIICSKNQTASQCKSRVVCRCGL